MADGVLVALHALRNSLALNRGYWSIVSSLVPKPILVSDHLPLGRLAPFMPAQRSSDPTNVVFRTHTIYATLLVLQQIVWCADNKRFELESCASVLIKSML